MPEVAIRPAMKSDLDQLMRITTDYYSNRVWQMDRLADEGVLGSNFREVRLPREAHLEYPRTPAQVFETFQDNQQIILVAQLDERPIGYIRISDQVAPRTGWVKDWAVDEKFRRKGVGAALLLAGLEWSTEQGYRRTVVEMQSKNFPAIQLVRKLGFEFAGFSDQYYSNQDIALFFGRSLR
jgi:ribosomal protein S18 acetylase RimI-like enzyme